MDHGTVYRAPEMLLVSSQRWFVAPVVFVWLSFWAWWSRPAAMQNFLTREGVATEEVGYNGRPALAVRLLLCLQRLTCNAPCRPPPQLPGRSRTSRRGRRLPVK